MTGKRKSFSLNDKRRLIEAYDKLPKMSQRVAATKLGIPQATLCSLLKRRQTVLAANNGDRKRIRSGKAPVVEAALVKWIDNAQSCNAPLSAPLVKEKAEELAAKLGEDNFKVSIGWFERFKKRENIVFKKLHGEAAEADMVSPGEWLEDQWRHMRQEYTEENIWNAAESGIYFRALPHSTFTFRSDNKRGGKKLKERITALFACSAAGEKKELFVISKSHNPRCFNYVHTLPVRYAANAPAWMTRNLFVGWLKEWDRKLAQERRKILLLVDSSPAHDITNTTLRNIRVEFLPKNATSFLQPCDQGIIRTAKAYFRKEMARTVLQKIDEGSPATAVDIVKKISLLDAVLMLRDAWADVGASTIRDCWRTVGLVMSLKEELETVDPPAEISAEEFEQWIAVDDSTPVSEPVTDEDIIAAVREGFGMGTDTSDEEEEKVETVVPSRAEMRNAIRILKTGLPHVGFNNFDLLHHFAKEVNLVLDKTTIRICEMTYPHGTEPTHKTEKNMLDFVFSVDDPVTWHTMNLMQNRKHYSFLKYLGPKKISSIQNDHGAGVYYNTLVPADGRIIKYGIISTDTLIEDLLYWKTLYIAGRLHKPVKILLQNDNAKLWAALVANLKSAVTASFLMLPESFSEEDLFMQIAGLSYSGDFRMALGEDKSKVFNIVRENMQNFQLLYSSILQECPQVVYKPQQGKLEVDKSPEGQFTQLMALPRTLQQRITHLMDPPGKNHDVEEILLQVAQDPDCGTVVQQGISSIVKSSSITQSLKGIATAGLMKTVSYSAKKVQKMWKGWRRRT